MLRGRPVGAIGHHRHRAQAKSLHRLEPPPGRRHNRRGKVHSHLRPEQGPPALRLRQHRAGLRHHQIRKHRKAPEIRPVSFGQPNFGPFQLWSCFQGAVHRGRAARHGHPRVDALGGFEEDSYVAPRRLHTVLAALQRTDRRAARAGLQPASLHGAAGLAVPVRPRLHKHEEKTDDFVQTVRNQGPEREKYV